MTPAPHSPAPETPPAPPAPARGGVPASAGLAVRHRPLRFAELVGQRHVAAVLREAAQAEVPPQQILLSGGSGLGKTTAARIFAAALLCRAPADGDACGECSSCVQVRAGNHPDVIEMDAASNGGKDEVNDLAARARTMPLEGRFKVYIVDEAHGLSRAGGEAFLKLLEEPPAHVIFVLATTDPDKMLATNRGRCLELELLPPAAEELATHLVAVAGAEGWELEEWAATAVVERADPRLGVRGVVMALAKLSGPLTRHEPITEALLAEYLAWMPQHRLAELVATIDRHDAAAALEALGALQRGFGDETVRQALTDWARRSLRAEPSSVRAVWALETIAATPAGALWTEAMVARLASPSLDGTPQAVAALVEEARSLITALEAATEAAAVLPAAQPVQSTQPVQASRPAPPIQVAPEPTSEPEPAPRAAPAPQPHSEDAPPYDPAYDEPPMEDEGYGEHPEPAVTRRAAEQAPRRRDRRKPSGGTKPAVSAAPAPQPAAPPTTAGRPNAPGTGVVDPWFDNPDAYDTRVSPREPQAPTPAPNASPNASARPQVEPTPKSAPKPARPQSEGDPATTAEVMELLGAQAPASAQLLGSCQLVMRDGALFVVVPQRLADAARRSPLRQDLARVCGSLPVHYRVRP